MNAHDELLRVTRLRGPSVCVVTLLALFDSPVRDGDTARKCSSCGGTGVFVARYPTVCAVCGGTGFLVRRQHGHSGI